MIIIIWVLLILTILTISAAHRGSFALRLSGFQNDTLKAIYSAKAACNLVIAKLKEDMPGAYDSFNEEWANNVAMFEKISMESGDKNNNYAEVFYNTVNEINEPIKIFGALDQDSLININSASLSILKEVFIKANVVASEDLANNILAWRGDETAVAVDYSDLGYNNKALPFTNKEEMLLIKGIDEDVYNKISRFICVNTNTDFKININTASKDVLEIIFGFAGLSNVNKAVVSDIVFKARCGDDTVWGTEDDMVITDAKAFLNSAAIINYFDAQQLAVLEGIFKVKSDFFEIRAFANFNKIKKSIIVVYNRQDDKIIYYCES